MGGVEKAAKLEVLHETADERDVGHVEVFLGVGVFDTSEERVGVVGHHRGVEGEGGHDVTLLGKRKKLL